MADVGVLLIGLSVLTILTVIVVVLKPKEPSKPEGTLDCRWACDDPVCKAPCRAVCSPPVCHYSKNGEDVSAPPGASCSISCPRDQMPGEDCPACETRCAAVEGYTVLCEATSCTWSCGSPDTCPKPTCNLVCPTPACATAAPGSGASETPAPTPAP